MDFNIFLLDFFEKIITGLLFPLIVVLISEYIKNPYKLTYTTN